MTPIAFVKDLPIALGDTLLKEADESSNVVIANSMIEDRQQGRFFS